jgi:two-component system sensor histidine kinase CpxA
MSAISTPFRRRSAKPRLALPRTLFGKIFIWSVAAQLATLGSILVLVTVYLPGSETAVNNAWMLYAHTAVVVYEKFGAEALDQFLSSTGEDTLLKLQLAADRSGTSCGAEGQMRAGDRSTASAVSGDTLTIATRGLDGSYCLTVHASAGGLPESPESRRARWQIGIIFQIVSCAGLSYAIARYLSRPISELQHAVARLARGDLAARVGPKFALRQDEAADLVREFDQMAERVAGLIEAQRRLIGDISHEIKSPLGRLSVALGLARRAGDGASAKQFDRIEREIGKISVLVSELLTLANLDQPIERGRMAPVDVAALIERTVADATYESQGRAADVSFRRPAHPVAVPGDAALLRRAIENVVRNALFYTAPGVGIEIELVEPRPGWITIEVRDRGPGVPEAALAHLFEPFYRVDQARARQTGGTGMGLAICQRAIGVHGGIVLARLNRPSGLIVALELPTAPPA